MAIDLYRRFRPTPSQRKFLASKARGRLFSSGYGSGKSKTGCRESIRWAVQYPGSRNLIGRLTATDLRDTTMVTFWREMDEIGFKKDADYTFNKSTNTLDWWNGSQTIFRHLDDPLALGSLELSSAFIDEGAEVSDAVLTTLYSSRLRWHLPGCGAAEERTRLIEHGASDDEITAVECECPHGMWSCTNPGASGFLKAVTQGKVDGWDWIWAKPGDNKHNGPDYYAQMKRLESVNGSVWMKRYYEGSWDAFEGQRFTSLDRDTHVLSVAWRPTDVHEVYEGWDFGHNETFVCWMAYNPRIPEPIVVFHELQVQKVQRIEEVSDAVHDIRKSYGIQKKVIALGDPAGVGATSQFSAVTPIGAYAAKDIFIQPCRAGKSPFDRANLIDALLNQRKRQPDGSIWPGLMFGPNCPAVYASCAELRWKDTTGRNGEDPKETFLDKNKHGFDALGYGLIGVPPPDVEPVMKRRKGTQRTLREVLEDEGILG